MDSPAVAFLGQAHKQFGARANAVASADVDLIDRVCHTAVISESAKKRPRNVNAPGRARGKSLPSPKTEAEYRRRSIVFDRELEDMEAHLARVYRERDIYREKLDYLMECTRSCRCSSRPPAQCFEAIKTEPKSRSIISQRHSAPLPMLSEVQNGELISREKELADLLSENERLKASVEKTTSLREQLEASQARAKETDAKLQSLRSDVALLARVLCPSKAMVNGNGLPSPPSTTPATANVLATPFKPRAPAHLVAADSGHVDPPRSLTPMRTSPPAPVSSSHPIGLLTTPPLVHRITNTGTSPNPSGGIDPPQAPLSQRKMAQTGSPSEHAIPHEESPQFLFHPLFGTSEDKRTATSEMLQGGEQNKENAPVSRVLNYSPCAKPRTITERLSSKKPKTQVLSGIVESPLAPPAHFSTDAQVRKALTPRNVGECTAPAHGMPASSSARNASSAPVDNVSDTPEKIVELLKLAYLHVKESNFEEEYVQTSLAAAHTANTFTVADFSKAKLCHQKSVRSTLKSGILAKAKRDNCEDRLRWLRTELKKCIESDSQAKLPSQSSMYVKVLRECREDLQRVKAEEAELRAKHESLRLQQEINKDEEVCRLRDNLRMSVTNGQKAQAEITELEGALRLHHETMTTRVTPFVSLCLMLHETFRSDYLDFVRNFPHLISILSGGATGRDIFPTILFSDTVQVMHMTKACHMSDYFLVVTDKAVFHVDSKSRMCTHSYDLSDIRSISLSFEKHDVVVVHSRRHSDSFYRTPKRLEFLSALSEAFESATDKSLEINATKWIKVLLANGKTSQLSLKSFDLSKVRRRKSHVADDMITLKGKTSLSRHRTSFF